jgi:hypothetical protein
MKTTSQNAQIINDLDEFIQREGLITNKILLRSKLRLINNLLGLGKTKTKVRGLLIRLNKLEPAELTIRVLDIQKTISRKLPCIKSYRKITLTRLIEPKDIIEWICEESYPLGLEYL